MCPKDQSSAPSCLYYTSLTYVIVDNLETIAKIYADDTKLIAIIKEELDALMLQSDLFKIHSWTREWLIQLNIDKCKIMHLGRRNTAFNYTINNGSSIQSLHNELRLGF